MSKYYAGIGSRTISKDMYKDMAYIASALEDMGYWLRSGNATGSDQAFASGVKTNAQIWLPWEDFEKEFQLEHPNHTYLLPDDDPEAYASVKAFHPNYNNVEKTGGKKFNDFMGFMSRNYRQVIGKGIEQDSRFIICWTLNADYIGGTAQAMRIADHFDIPIYNMAALSKEEVLKKIDLQMMMFDYLDND